MLVLRCRCVVVSHFRRLVIPSHPSAPVVTLLLLFLGNCLGQTKKSLLSPPVFSSRVTTALTFLFQAFSWWPELMAEHATHFLSLYQAHVDSALAVQAVDSWDSFPLFQLLNNFLRTDRESSATWLLLLLLLSTC